MSTALARLRAHSEALLAQGPKSFEVPELADPQTGEALRIYVWPITAREKGLILREVEEGDKGTALTKTIVLRARDANKQPLFSPDDLDALLDMSLDGLLERIASKISSAWPSVSTEEAKGN